MGDEKLVQLEFPFELKESPPGAIRRIEAVGKLVDHIDALLMHRLERGSCRCTADRSEFSQVYFVSRHLRPPASARNPWFKIHARAQGDFVVSYEKNFFNKANNFSGMMDFLSKYGKHIPQLSRCEFSYDGIMKM